MAVSLVAEVVAFIAGSDLTMSERFVLMAIAEQANVKTRQAWQQNGMSGGRRWVLAEVVGLSSTGLREVLQRLAKRGLEVRVPISVAEDGRAVYAARGHQTTYRLPALPRLEGDAGSSAMDEIADGEPSPIGEKGDGQPSQGDGQPSQGDGQPSPYPSVSRQSPNSMRAREPRQIVMEHTDAKPSEADAVVTRIVNEVNPRSLGGFLTHLAKAGDLQTYVGEARAARIRSDLKDSNARRQSMPDCDHGVPGGDQIHPTSGEPWCPKCRWKFRANRARSDPGACADVIPLPTREVS